MTAWGVGAKRLGRAFAESKAYTQQKFVAGQMHQQLSRVWDTWIEHALVAQNLRMREGFIANRRAARLLGRWREALERRHVVAARATVASRAQRFGLHSKLLGAWMSWCASAKASGRVGAAFIQTLELLASRRLTRAWLLWVGASKGLVNWGERCP